MCVDMPGRLAWLSTGTACGHDLPPLDQSLPTYHPLRLRRCTQGGFQASWWTGFVFMAVLSGFVFPSAGIDAVLFILPAFFNKSLFGIAPE